MVRSRERRQERRQGRPTRWVRSLGAPTPGEPESTAPEAGAGMSPLLWVGLIAILIVIGFLVFRRKR